MPWELLELILIVVMVFSQIAMINHTTAKDKDQSTATFIFFYNVFRIPEYIEITRKEKGRIGGWFWAFMISIMLLIVVVAIQVFMGQ